MRGEGFHFHSTKKVVSTRRLSFLVDQKKGEELLEETELSRYNLVGGEQFLIDRDSKYI